MSVAHNDFDLVVEGDAERIIDPSTVAVMAERWAAGGWPARCGRLGHRPHRRLQRTLGRTAAVDGLPPDAPPGDRAADTIEPGGATRWTFSE